MRPQSHSFASVVFILLFTSVGFGQDFNPDKTVVPIAKIQVGLSVEVDFGTGACLDSGCKLILTNYHVAQLAGQHLKIKGEKVVDRYLATGPNDIKATLNPMMDSNIAPMVFNRNRDLTVFELKHPLRGMRGPAFSLDELEPGQQVDIWAFPLASEWKRRSLRKWNGTFVGQTEEGLLAFSIESNRQTLKPGSSGGIVVDKMGREVGVLMGVSHYGTAVAVSIQNLADFIKAVNPDLYSELFPEIRDPMISKTDLYPRYDFTPSQSLQFRQEESDDINRLRESAQQLADSMRDFIAVESFEYGGMKSPPPTSRFEVRVMGGQQRFRALDSEKELVNVPLPSVNPILAPGGEWSNLPTLVGTKLRLRIHEAPETVVDGKRIKVFQYYGAVEDDVCSFRSIDDYVLFQHTTEKVVACWGEAWTDAEFNIIRISENDESLAEWKHYRAVVTYDWLDKDSRRLVPVSIQEQAERKGKVFSCRGRFTNYRVFTAKSKLIFDAQE